MELATALAGHYAEAHELIRELTEKVDSTNPDTADWGHVGDLRRVIDGLRELVSGWPTRSGA